MRTQASNSDSYYRQAIINGQYRFEGKFPIDEQAAKRLDCYHFNFDADGVLLSVEYLRAGRLRTDNTFGVAKIKIDYNRGIEHRCYYNEKGKPAKDFTSGVFSVRLKQDKINRTLTVYNYDRSGELCKNKFGVAAYVYQLNAEDRRANAMYFDTKGNRIWSSTGVYEAKYSYDSKGNLVEQLNCGVDGKAKDNKEKVAVIRWTLDETGNVTEQRYFSSTGELRNHSVDKIAIIRDTYDANGNITEMKFLSNESQLKEEQGYGVAVTKYKYDDFGNIIEESYYGIDERPKNMTIGEHFSFAAVHYFYNGKGKLLKTKYIPKRKLVS